MDPITLGTILGLVGVGGRWLYTELQYYRSAEKKRKDAEAARKKAVAAALKLAQGKLNRATADAIARKAAEMQHQYAELLEKMRNSELARIARAREAARHPR